jgi:hypothetical protein
VPWSSEPRFHSNVRCLLLLGLWSLWAVSAVFSVIRHGKLALTLIWCNSDRADQASLEEINLSAAVHLAFDQLPSLRTGDVVVLVAPRRTSSGCSRSKTDVPFNEPLCLSSAMINGSAAHPIAIVPDRTQHRRPAMNSRRRIPSSSSADSLSRSGLHVWP